MRHNDSLHVLLCRTLRTLTLAALAAPAAPAAHAAGTTPLALQTRFDN